MTREDMIAHILATTSEYTVLDLNAMSEDEVVGIYYDIVGMEGKDSEQYDDGVDW